MTVSTTMPKRQPVDDLAGLDEEDLEILGLAAQPSTLSPFPSTDSNVTSTNKTTLVPTKTSSILNARVARKIWKPDGDFTVLTFEDHEPKNKHFSTTNFEKKIEITALDLAHFWFFQGSPYEHVCLARQNCYNFVSGKCLGEFFTRGAFQYQLYAYTVKRTAAVGVLLSSGFEVLNDGLSATDEAFAVIVEALVHNYDDILPYIVDWPEKGRPRTLMIDHPRLLKAIHVVRSLPMKFLVKATTDGPDGDAEEKVAFLRFGEGTVEGKVNLDVAVEIVNVVDADKICRGNEYEM